METKALIRKHALKLRDSLSEEERKVKSDRIMREILACEEYGKSENILVYVAYRSEVDTGFLIQVALQEGKAVYCPKVHGSEMEFYRIYSMEDLRDGYKGIREPLADDNRIFNAAEEGQCLMLMPGSAFDRQRNRIGYGGGYYDKYLAKHPGLNTMAVCFECQIQKNIPADTYDRKPDAVLTECNIYR